MKDDCIKIEDIKKAHILEDMHYLSESLIYLKRSVVALGNKDTDNEIYHRFCDTEDEVNNILEEVKFILRG